MSSPEDSAKDQSSPDGSGDKALDQPLQALIQLLLDLNRTQQSKEPSDQSAVSEGIQATSPPSLNQTPKPEPLKSTLSSQPPSQSQPPKPPHQDQSPAQIKSQGQPSNPAGAKTPKPQHNSDFLRQAENDIRFVLSRLEEKIIRLEHKIDEPTELINPLLPLITELLAIRSTEPNSCLLQALVPLIDEAIQQRSRQDQAKMGAAIGQILPAAIAYEIQYAPAMIARAIAPELAMSIQEQAELDPDAIARSLGPQMGKAISNQILVERDAIVDALYPVIGTTISKYMVEFVKSINAKVESSLSLEGILRKIRARLKGVSEAELILQESVECKVQAVLLIHKASGLVIRDLQPSSSFQIEADMLAGMLTAIRSFVGECMTGPETNSELHEIEYNASKIILEVAGYCYLAVIVKGEPSKVFIEKIRTTLSQIVLNSGKAIAAYNGDPSLVPTNVDLCLDLLSKADPKPEPKPHFPVGIVVVLGIILIPLGILSYRSHIARQIEAKTAAALDGVPELSIYRIVPEVNWGKLTLSGRLPNAHLRQLAETTVRQAVSDWPLNNRILTVDVPADPTSTAGEVERVTWIFNQKPGVAIAAHHKFGSNSVDVTGIVSTVQDVRQLTQSLKQIPGIATVTSTVQVRPVLATRIYFDPNSSQVQSPENLTKLRTVRQFLEQNPGVALRIIGHSDPTGESLHNRQLSLERARSVQQILISEGINPAHLQIQASNVPPPSITPRQPIRLSRSVRFEVYIPAREQD